MKRRSGFDRMELFLGILLILLGIFTFIRPGSILTGIIVVYGVIAIVTGIEDIVIYVKVEKYTGFGPMMSLISGILSVMCGIMLLLYPGAGKWVLSLLFPVWFIAHCISRLSHIGMIRMTRGKFAYYASLVVYIVGLVLGFLMIFRPMLTFLSMRAVGYVIAVYLVLLGIDSVVTSFRRRDR